MLDEWIQCDRCFRWQLSRFGVTPETFECSEATWLPLAEKLAAKRVCVGSRGSATSRYRGVSYRAHLGDWVARIQCQKKSYNLGIFPSDLAAAQAYDRAAVELGAPQKCNFPDQIEELGEAAADQDSTLGGGSSGKGEEEMIDWIQCDECDRWHVSQFSAVPKAFSCGDAQWLPTHLRLCRIQGSASSFRGVSYYNGRWVARYNQHGNRKFLGSFHTEMDAACAYDQAAIHSGKPEKCNFKEADVGGADDDGQGQGGGRGNANISSSSSSPSSSSSSSRPPLPPLRSVQPPGSQVSSTGRRCALSVRNGEPKSVLEPKSVSKVSS